VRHSFAVQDREYLKTQITLIRKNYIYFFPKTGGARKI